MDDLHGSDDNRWCLLLLHTPKQTKVKANAEETTTSAAIRMIVDLFLLPPSK